ncbi:hypothetical protein IU433_26450 [Nocardia puris]|uniref:hypothetical protein n=1 Tax=Nocardia TaxID=1817 RepID=UPI0018930ECD|nr:MULTISPECIES: hypothetical protein [Nocardia]MBF6185084.1 hypothetical protein [Nocardia farcinica]MBF6462556.1 hypothetical protein [Nocardia puris]
MPTMIRVGERYYRSSGETRRATRHQVESVAAARAALIAVAQLGEKITYTDLAAAIGAYNYRNIGTLLDAVAVDCRKRREPNLPAIAVTIATDEPGYEYAHGNHDRIRSDQRKVWNRWRGHRRQRGEE